MSRRDHPGQVPLALQLISALNEELMRHPYPPPFTFDQVSQLEQGLLAALATIHEFKNSSVPINRTPFDVLSLIPTYLSSPSEVRKATSVCRHWRRTFLQRGELWSEVILSRGEVHVKTYLERANGAALDIFAHYLDPVATWSLISPHAERIRYLEFEYKELKDIQKISDAILGRLSILHTLTITSTNEGGHLANSTNLLPSYSQLFGSAANLKVFRIQSESSFLKYLVFPNLVSFDFSAQQDQRFRITELLDFLEATPTLQSVELEVFGCSSPEDAPRGRIITLPNVQQFTLLLGNGSQSEFGYWIAAHLRCPSVKSTSFVHAGDYNNVLGKIFPGPDSWNAIVSQYTATSNPIEEVILEIIPPSPITCKITFQYRNGSVVELHFEEAEPNEATAQSFSPEVYSHVIAQATRTLREHPQLQSIKCVHIRHGLDEGPDHPIEPIAISFWGLFVSLGRLEQLTISSGDLRPYLYPFFEGIGSDWIKNQELFPQTKRLTISSRKYTICDAFYSVIIQLAHLQHSLKKPFEYVEFRAGAVPYRILEVNSALTQWVKTDVEYFESPDDN